MSLIGSVDTLWNTSITGWACDDADPATVVRVEILVNSVIVANIPCTDFRQDLLEAGIGDGAKGFHFNPSEYLTPGRNVLEVQYAGTRKTVPYGRGNWTNLREGELSASQAEFLAALEAHYEFKPDGHICLVGSNAAGTARIFMAGNAPHLKCSRLQPPADPGAVWLTQKADLIVACGCVKPDVIEHLLQDHAEPTAVLALHEPGESAGRLNNIFRALGIVNSECESILDPESGACETLAVANRTARFVPGRAPLLAHVHVPKCAGTSLRLLQERHFGQRHLGLYVDDTYFVFSQHVLRGYLLQNPELQGFSSHHVRIFPRFLGGREMLYVSFLRDPVQQFVSYMTHIKKYYAGITAKSLLEAVPPDAPKWALRDFARWLLTQRRDVPFRENHNVNFFTRHSAPNAPNRLEAAKAVLEKFFFVGITELMDKSLQILRARIAAAGVEFPPEPMPLENISADYRDDLNWITERDEVGAMLLRSVAEDRLLYDWAVARLDQAAA